MMESGATTPERPTDAPRSLRRALVPVLAFVFALWGIELTQALTELDLTRFGVFPRRAEGLAGILWAPLIHGSWTHLFANTAPVIVLGTALLYGYPRAARFVLPAVYLGAGLAVWLFARPSFHIGASGLTFGVLFFVFTIGVLRWDPRAIALSMIVFFLYGSTVWGILPHDPTVSYETHLAGAIIGIALAFALKRLDPPLPRKRYSWEDEEPGSADAHAPPGTIQREGEHCSARAASR